MDDPLPAGPQIEAVWDEILSNPRLYCLVGELDGQLISSCTLATGALIAALAVGAFFLIPGYFALTMAILGGGLLIASGTWMIRAGK